MSKNKEFDITTLDLDDGDLKAIEENIPPEELEIIKERIAFVEDPTRWVIAADHNGHRFYYSLGHARFVRDFQDATKFKIEDDAHGFMYLSLIHI